MPYSQTPQTGGNPFGDPANQAQMAPAGMPMMPANGMMTPELMKHMQSLPPDQRDALIAQMSRDYEAEGSAMDEQAKRAAAMRDTATPEGRTTRGIYQAANPLEHIGAGLQRYKGIQDMKGIDAQRGTMRKDKSGMLADLMRGLGGFAK